jgi:hypothetical protein
MYNDEVTIYDISVPFTSPETVATAPLPASYERLGSFVDVLWVPGLSEEDIQPYRFCSIARMIGSIRSHIEATTECSTETADEIVEDLNDVLYEMKIGDLLYMNKKKNLVYVVGPSDKATCGKKFYLASMPVPGNPLVIPHAVCRHLSNPIRFYRRNIQEIEESIVLECNEGEYTHIRDNDDIGDISNQLSGMSMKINTGMDVDNDTAIKII